MSDDLQQRLHQQTARIPWSELQRFFAQGRVLQVAGTQDLVKVAAQLAEDQVSKIDALMNAQQVAFVTDSQARKWVQQDSEVWSVVVAPFVLVQDSTTNNL